MMTMMTTPMTMKLAWWRFIRTYYTWYHGDNAIGPLHVSSQ